MEENQPSAAGNPRWKQTAASSFQGEAQSGGCCFPPNRENAKHSPAERRRPLLNDNVEEQQNSADGTSGEQSQILNDMECESGRRSAMEAVRDMSAAVKAPIPGKVSLGHDLVVGIRAGDFTQKETFVAAKLRDERPNEEREWAERMKLGI
ncbi:hypothetical protein CSAL01_05645 [Colletotrichum salicis]|uniref:Uncharacterized protein n=1 Tax=Colletotrichum salicis TaxID=1209931 RepID=A0A135TJ92_9PEZI|nr:hypothetical protein CSAL01_05645 [Colletotrichum salicis]